MQFDEWVDGNLITIDWSGCSFNLIKVVAGALKVSGFYLKRMHPQLR